MRKQALLGLLAILGLCVSVRAAAVAADERPAAAEKSVVLRVEAADAGSAGEDAALSQEPGISPGVETPLLDPRTVFNHVIVGPGGKVVYAGVDTEEGSVAGFDDHIIYANTLGISTVNFTAGQPGSDDITTIAPDGCKLTRFKFKTLGRVLQSGKCFGGSNHLNVCTMASDCPGGTCSIPDPGLPYTVNYAMYTNCPLAVGSSESVRDLVKIPGTDGFLSFPDDSPQSIEHIVEAITPVALPNNVYFSLRFNRANCGTVIGAPALTGYSGDIWDFPGFPCNGFLGGFPQLPHASFWLEMYGSTNCSPAFSAYKCQRPSGGVAAIGANIQGVDDIKLIVNNCHVIGYEVAVRGVGFYTFDLRRDCDGSVVPGSERTFAVNASTTPLLQVARFTFDPPLILTTDSLYLGFKCSSNSAGAVVAGIQPIIGSSETDYFTIGGEGCSPVQPTQGVHGAINLAITCSGAQPLGACCDPHLTECKGGPDDGKRCPFNASCVGGANDGKPCSPSALCPSPGVCTPFCAAPGTCESVCRETTEINCPFPPRGQEQRPKWLPGATCEKKCIGGSNDDNPCETNAECPGGGQCNPFGNNPCGVAACCHLAPNPSNPTILDEVCANLTKNDCDATVPTDKARLWQLGEYCGLGAQDCPRNACLARDGSCYITHSTAGCDDPFCCSDVCDHGEVGAFCCNTAWDSACVALAEADCPLAPPNDQCAPGFPVRNFEGALTIPAPGSRPTSNVKATESILEPGFCCNSGVGACIGGPAPGTRCIVDADCVSLPADPSHCSERFPDPGAPALGTVWFKWVQPNNQTSAGISTCTSNSPALDSVLQIFEANDDSSQLNACNSLSMIGCNDDFQNCSSTHRNSRVCLRNLTPGKTYYILLGAKTDNRRGQYIVSISTSCSTSPASDPIPNDYCRNATPISDPTPEDPLVVPFALGRFCLSGAGAGLPCTSDSQCRVCSGGTNAGAVCVSSGTCPGGTCPSVPSGVCPASGPTFECPAESCSPGAQEDVWFEYTATCTGEATFSTCGPSEPDTNIAVYDGCTACPSTLHNLLPIGCNKDAELPGCFTPAQTTAEVVEGQCYLVRVANEGGFAVSGNLTITCSQGPTGCSGFVSSNPADCIVDARRPYPPNQLANLELSDSLTMTFGQACNAAPGDFTVTCSPTAAPCPTVANVSAAGPVQTITLSSPIPAGNWTCVSHTGTGAKVCMGSLPGDADGGMASGPTDILEVIDNLNGIVVPPLTMDHCDMDRSGACVAADIISVIDMLNGTNGYAVWNGATLPVCPAP